MPKQIIFTPTAASIAGSGEFLLSLSQTGDGTGLTGDVLLTAGSGIAITQDNATGELTISATLPEEVVTLLNGLTGVVLISPADGVTVQTVGNAIQVGADFTRLVSSIGINDGTVRLAGAMELVAGSNITLTKDSSHSFRIDATAATPAVASIAAGGGITVNSTGSAFTITNSGVTSLNGATGAVTLAGAGSVSVNRSGGTVTITGSPAQLFAAGRTVSGTPVSFFAGSGISLSATAASITITGSGVNAINALTGAVSLVAGTGVTVATNLGTGVITISSGSGLGVTSLNSKAGAITLTAGTGISIDNSSPLSVVIAATGAITRIDTDSGSFISGSAVLLSAGTGMTVATAGSNRIIISSSITATTLNSQSGAVHIVAGNGISVASGGGNISVTNTGVRTLNTLNGDVIIAAGSGISVSTAGSTITVRLAATSGVSSINGLGGAITLAGSSTISLSTVSSTITLATVGGVQYISPNGTGALSGVVSITGGTDISVTHSGNTIIISSTGSSGVTSLNSFGGAVSIVAGAGVSVTNSGNTITIGATGGGGSGGLHILFSGQTAHVYGPFVEVAVLPSTSYQIQFSIATQYPLTNGPGEWQFDIQYEVFGSGQWSLPQTFRWTRLFGTTNLSDFFLIGGSGSETPAKFRFRTAALWGKGALNYTLAVV